VFFIPERKSHRLRHDYLALYQQLSICLEPACELGKVQACSWDFSEVQKYADD